MRAEYEVKLAALQERRETLYRSMREDLERGFREARAQVAAVVRELQSGGSARDATRAQQRLAELAAEQRELDREAGPPAAQAPALARLDWRHARVGDSVEVRGGGKGRLLSLPDPRGRVSVGVGSARLVLAMELVGATPGVPPARREARRPAPRHSRATGRRARSMKRSAAICAVCAWTRPLARLAEALDRAAALREREPRDRAWHRNRRAARRRAPTPRRNLPTSIASIRADPARVARASRSRVSSRRAAR